MKALGFSDREIAAGMDALKKSKASAARVGKVGIAEGGGGARRAGYAGAAGSGNSKYNWKNRLGKRKKARNPASVAGMKKKFGNDVIGVATDNIFKMVRRRYDKKRKINAFIEKR